MPRENFNPFLLCFCSPCFSYPTSGMLRLQSIFPVGRSRPYCKRLRGFYYERNPRAALTPKVLQPAAYLIKMSKAVKWGITFLKTKNLPKKSLMFEVHLFSANAYSEINHQHVYIDSVKQTHNSWTHTNIFFNDCRYLIVCCVCCVVAQIIWW